jgi:hypothetical protein
MSKQRLMTIGIAAVAGAVVTGFLLSRARAAVKDGKKAEDTLAGKIGLV